MQSVLWTHNTQPHRNNREWRTISSCGETRRRTAPSELEMRPRKGVHVLVQCVQFHPTLEKCWHILVMLIMVKLHENSGINKLQQDGSNFKLTFYEHKTLRVTSVSYNTKVGQKMNMNCIYFQLSCRDADKSLARPGRKQATATEDFEFHISQMSVGWCRQ